MITKLISNLKYYTMPNKVVAYTIINIVATSWSLQWSSPLVVAFLLFTLSTIITDGKVLTSIND